MEPTQWSPGSQDDRVDDTVRAVAFRWLDDQVQTHGDVLPRNLLTDGFEFGGRRVPLVAPQGIFKPAVMQLPLTITTSPNGPYDDSFGPDNLLRYRYRGHDPGHRDNTGLRACMHRHKPLVYLHGVVPGKYLAVWPVFVVGDDPASLAFTIAADDVQFAHPPNDGFIRDASEGPRRAYITASVQRRLHQRGFRERVIAAYRSQCALCRLKHPELLDAAHIIADSEPEGSPIVSNGISLCKIHHAAYDRDLIGISPDYDVAVHPTLLDEEDGPMLKHGLQEMHGGRLLLPRKPELQPDPDRLALRWERFRVA